MSNFKKRWEQELDLIIPELDEKVKNEPIQTNDCLPEKLPPFKKLANFLFSHQKGFAIGATSFALILIFCFTMLFGPLSLGASKSNAVVFVEVNPSVVFCLDKNGKVSSVTAANADADVILTTTQESLIGLKVEDAVQSYLDSLAKTGYLPQEGAIKISGTGEQETIKNAKNSAENFFMDKGLYVAVAGTALSNDEFCDYLKIDKKQNVNDIFNHFSKETPLYASRLSTERPGESIEHLYEEVVPEEYIIQSFIFELKNQRGAFNAYFNDFKNLSDINSQIREHEDNPLRYLADYWVLKSSDYFNVDDFSESLKALFVKADELMAHIEGKHGEVIESTAELEGKLAFLTLFIESIDFLTSEEVFEHFEDIIHLLKEINADVQKLTSLFSLPQSVDQYLTNLNDYYLSRVQYYNDIYNTVRESISSIDYQSFLDNLKNTYGSIENYWLSLKN